MGGHDQDAFDLFFGSELADVEGAFVCHEFLSFKDLRL
jgi:hypothetical protein